MKRLGFIVTVIFALGMASCTPKDPDPVDPNSTTHDYTYFIGTWGVEHIDYYNIDYAGQPIAASTESFDFIPGDMENGIDLIFRSNKTGEMRDRSRDTLYMDWNSETHEYETFIVCPDTTVVTNFTYSYNSEDNLLFMNMQVEHPFIYQMNISFVSDSIFVYVNEYETDYVEKAKMVRYSTETRGTKSSTWRSCHPKSLLSNY